MSEEVKVEKTKKKLQKAEDFIGWKSEDGLLEVVGIHGKCDSHATFKVICHKCKEICESEGYEPVGFIREYKNNRSRFEYLCPKHGKQNVSYDNFVNNGRRCKGCYKDRQKELGSLYGYYPERKDEQDFLYILDFDSKFLKVGRSFNIDRRIGELISSSKIKKIHKLRIFTATHQEIYDLEQELHSELRERNFQHYVKWSKECFNIDCLFILNKLLDICCLKEVHFMQ